MTTVTWAHKNVLLASFPWKREAALKKRIKIFPTGERFAALKKKL